MVVWRDEAGWQVEGIVNFSPNMPSFLLTLGSQRWYIVGAYVPPKRCTRCISRGSGLVGGSKGSGGNTVGEINGKLQETQDAQEEDIATVLADCGLVDMTVHFTPRGRYRGGV